MPVFLSEPHLDSIWQTILHCLNGGNIIACMYKVVIYSMWMCKTHRSSAHGCVVKCGVYNYCLKMQSTIQFWFRKRLMIFESNRQSYYTLPYHGPEALC